MHALRLSTRGVVAACLAGVLAFAIAACGDDEEDGAAGEGGTEKVTLALGFTPNYIQAYFFDALEKGYYEDAGLDVDYVVPDSTQTAAKLVGIGRAQFGEFVGPDPITAVAEDVPVKVATTWAPSGDYGLLSKPGEVTSATDLAGETVGTFSGLVYSTVCLPRFLEDNGVSPDDVETVDTKFAAIPPLLADKVLATEGIVNIEGAIYTEEVGDEADFMSYGDVCPLFPQGLFVDDSWAQENPETARAFVEATLLGVKDFVEDPAGTRDSFIARFPDIEDPIGFYEAAVPTFCAPETADLGLGYNDHQQWEELIQVTVEGEAIEEAMPVEDVITDEYLPEEPVLTDACD